MQGEGSALEHQGRRNRLFCDNCPVGLEAVQKLLQVAVLAPRVQGGPVVEEQFFVHEPACRLAWEELDRHLQANSVVMCKSVTATDEGDMLVMDASACKLAWKKLDRHLQACRVTPSRHEGLRRRQGTTM